MCFDVLVEQIKNYEVIEAPGLFLHSLLQNVVFSTGSRLQSV